MLETPCLDSGSRVSIAEYLSQVISGHPERLNHFLMVVTIGPICTATSAMVFMIFIAGLIGGPRNHHIIAVAA